ncbi:MAG: hypothetical protein KME23_17440 [Goleter apudmare HA4340-LM2]|nr:hypothetical protein [Goleter apudmare HA4340-LM2]
MFEKFWANIIRYYTGKVHRPGLTQNQGFETCKGRFCLLDVEEVLEIDLA